VPESLAAETLNHPIELFRLLNGDNGVTQSVSREDLFIGGSWCKVNKNIDNGILVALDTAFLASRTLWPSF